MRNTDHLGMGLSGKLEYSNGSLKCDRSMTLAESLLRHFADPFNIL